MNSKMEEVRKGKSPEHRSFVLMEFGVCHPPGTWLQFTNCKPLKPLDLGFSWRFHYIGTIE